LNIRQDTKKGIGIFNAIRLMIINFTFLKITQIGYAWLIYIDIQDDSINMEMNA